MIKRVAATLLVLAFASMAMGSQLLEERETTQMSRDLEHVKVRPDPNMTTPPFPPRQSLKRVRSQPTTFEAAQAAVDFQILQPTFLPAGEAFYQIQLADFGNSGAVYLMYRGDDEHDLTIIQEPVRVYEGGGGITVAAEVYDVEVNRQPAAYYTRDVGQWTRSSLIWEQDNVLLQIVARGHTQEELIRVAESMGTQ